MDSGDMSASGVRTTAQSGATTYRHRDVEERSQTGLLNGLSHIRVHKSQTAVKLSHLERVRLNSGRCAGLQ